jgi:predicted nicotinamide N-methyase
MTAVAALAGAPTCVAVDWNSIDWKKVNRNARRLQVRIVKAIEEGCSIVASYHGALVAA